MASILKVNTIQDTDGNNIINENANVITIGASGDTITVPAGATVSGFTSAGIDDNATSTAITISSAGRIGIGTTAPDAELQIAPISSGTNASIVLANSNRSQYFRIQNNETNDALVFNANDTNERLRIDSSGNLLVGTTSSATTTAGVKLRSDNSIASVIDGGTSGYFGRLTSDGDVIKIRKDGTTVGVIGTQNWGIGTSSPGYPLQINSSAQTTLLHLVSTAGTSSAITFANTGSNDSITVGAENDDLKLRTDDGVIKFFTNENSERMRIDSSGNVGIGESSPGYNLVVDGGANTTIRVQNDTPYYGDFQATTTGIQIRTVGSYPLIFNTNQTERMRIHSSGNIGIGDTSPQDFVEINGSGRGLGGLTISNSSHSNAALSFARSLGATARIHTTEPGAASTSDLRFQTSDASGGAPNLITAMVINQNQNVGIGTTSPTQKLDVNGNAKFTQTYISSDDETNVFREITQVESSAQGWMVSTGALPIPSPGIYRVTAFCRLRWNVGSNYYKMSLFSSTSNTTNFTEDRMIIEHIEDDHGGFANVGMSADWIIDVPTGNTSGANVYVGFFAQFADSVFRCVNDANGRPYFMATKLRETTTTGTTLAEIRTHN